LEVLVLRSTGIKKIGDFKLPTKLKFLDISKNQISDLKALLKLVLKLPFIEILNVGENPVMSKGNLREKIIASNSNMTLRVLNGVEVSIEERIRVLF
jgi:Leucine-rich repeat (LRR) protein